MLIGVGGVAGLLVQSMVDDLLKYEIVRHQEMEVTVTGESPALGLSTGIPTPDIESTEESVILPRSEPIGDRTYAGKVSTVVQKIVHSCPRMLRHIINAIQHRQDQTTINPLFESALHTVRYSTVDLVSDRTIRDTHTMAGAIAMAYVGVELLQHATNGEFWTLIADAGTMWAGDQYQAVVASFTPTGVETGSYWEGEDTGFQRVTLGAIPIRDGTYEHRVERIMILFTEMLAATKHLGPFLGLEPAWAEALTLADLLAGCDSFLGGELPLAL